MSIARRPQRPSRLETPEHVTAGQAAQDGVGRQRPRRCIAHHTEVLAVAGRAAVRRRDLPPMSADGRTWRGRRPGRTCAGTPNPTQNRRSASASGAPGHHPHHTQAGLYQGRAPGGRPFAGTEGGRVQIRYRSHPTQHVTQRHPQALTGTSASRDRHPSWSDTVRQQPQSDARRTGSILKRTAARSACRPATSWHLTPSRPARSKIAVIARQQKGTTSNVSYWHWTALRGTTTSDSRTHGRLPLHGIRVRDEALMPSSAAGLRDGRSASPRRPPGGLPHDGPGGQSFARSTAGQVEGCPRYTVCHDGKSAGSCRQEHPAWTTYKIASTTAWRGCFSGRPPVLQQMIELALLYSVNEGAPLGPRVDQRGPSGLFRVSYCNHVPE